MTCIVQPGHNGSIAPLRLCERLYCGGQHLVVSQFLICPLITSSLCSMIFLIWFDHTLKNDVSRLHSARVLFAMFLFLPNLFYLAFRVVMIICIYTHWHVVKMRASFHWHSCSWQHSAHGLCGLVLGSNGAMWVSLYEIYFFFYTKLLQMRHKHSQYERR